MIETVRLTKMYGQLYALKELNLTLNEGDVYGFIGPNGAGKTTTMRILATLLNPSYGEAYVCGHSIYNGAKEIRRLVGYMPDFFGVYDDMKVIEYLEFFASAYRIKGAARRKICDEVLELVDLTYKRDALRDQPLPRHDPASRPGPHAPAQPAGPPARRARQRPRPAGPDRDAGLAQGAAHDGQDDPRLQPHPARAGRHLQQDRHHRARPVDRQRRRRRGDEAGPRRGRAQRPRHRPPVRGRHPAGIPARGRRASRTATARSSSGSTKASTATARSPSS